MLSRWIAITFALVPVVFVPACVSTHAVMVWRARTAVHGSATGEFPVLQIKSGSIDIAPLKVRDFKSTTFVAPAEQERIAQAVEKLPSTRLVDEDRHMGAKVDFQNLRPGWQRVHVTVRHEIGMGFIRTESWYDTDGRTLTPRFEREYPPSWMFLGAAVLAVPVSFAVSALLAPLLIALKKRGLPSLPVVRTRIVIAALLYLVAAMPFISAKPLLLVGVPIVIVAAYALSVTEWTRRKAALVILAIVGIDVVAGFLVADYVVFLMLACEFGMAVLFAVTLIIQRALAIVLAPPSP